MGLVYSHPRDNLLRTASTVTLETGTVVSSDTGTDNLFDQDPAHGLQLQGTSLDLRMGWDEAVLPAFPVLYHSNLDVVATLQSDATNDFSSPVSSDAFAVPGARQDGLFDAPFLDLRTRSAALWWRLLITANSRAIRIGELWLGQTYRRLDTATPSVAQGYQHRTYARTAEGTTRTIRTQHGVTLAYTVAPRIDPIAGTVIVHRSELAAIEDWVDAARFRARPFMVVPDETVDRAWFVRFGSDQIRRTPVGRDHVEVGLPLEPLSPGLAWINPDA